MTTPTHDHRPAGDGRGARRAAEVAVLVLLLAGCATAPDPAAAISVTIPTTHPEPASAANAAVADPVRLRIPAIGVDAPMQPHRVEHGVLAAPTRNEVAGWWRDGPEPGERGPAVIAGHVDSRRGPAVFYRLRELAAGASVHVDRADGSTAELVATRTERHPKVDFPTSSVYGSTPDATLRLVTCGGSFDRAAGSYRDNVIVFAVSAATQPR